MPDPPSESTALAVTWDDVLKPGSASGSRGAEQFTELAPRPSARCREFSLANACFLAAHSLLIYRKAADSPDTGEALPILGRAALLDQFGLKESFGAEIEGTVCSILEPAGTAMEPVPATVVFRGTSHFKNWLTNLQSLPTSWPGGGHVHGGFASANEEIWDQLAPRLDAFARVGRPVLITGHSLGGALATLTLSQYLDRHGASAAASAYTFGSPRVGNAEFSRSLEGAPLFRVVNNQDLVTRLPLPFSLSRRLSYLHAGAAYFLDSASRLHPRGQGDLAEEAAGLTQIKELARHASDAFRQVRPPIFLADHAPARYLDGLRRALAEST